MTAGSSAARRPAATLSLRESSSYSPRTVELRPGWPSASQAGRADARAPTSNGCAASPGRAHGWSESIPHPHRRRIEAVLGLGGLEANGPTTLLGVADARYGRRGASAAGSLHAPDPRRDRGRGRRRKSAPGGSQELEILCSRRRVHSPTPPTRASDARERTTARTARRARARARTRAESGAPNRTSAIRAAHDREMGSYAAAASPCKQI